MRLYRRFLFFFLSVGLLLTSCGVGRSLRHAEQSYARGEYFDAARHYKTAYTRTSPKDRSQGAYWPINKAIVTVASIIH